MSRESFTGRFPVRTVETRGELVVSREVLPETPTLVAIYTSPMTGEPMIPHTEIEAIAGEGLAGDRYNSGNDMRDYRGYYRGHRIPETDRQVTLIATGGIDDGNRYLAERGVDPMGQEKVRRNLVVKMDAGTLNGWVGKRFKVGDVLMEGVELCTPCVRPPMYLGREQQARSAFVKGFLPNGGLRARIIEGGTLRVGNSVRPVPTPTR